MKITKIYAYQVDLPLHEGSYKWSGLWSFASHGNWEEAREIYRWYTPLLHLDTHVKLVQYIKLAVQECGLGSETVRAPRLPLVGEERERILAIIRKGIETRPRILR